MKLANDIRRLDGRLGSLLLLLVCVSFTIIGKVRCEGSLAGRDIMFSTHPFVLPLVTKLVNIVF